ncbi:MAG: hypothetical protein PHS50_14305, partial [Kiritimatiellae bacterium]|nr:hypothetical protein [Kiritimatiellia bacterium]
LVDVAAYLGTYRVGAVLSEYGTVAGTGTYASGESVTITARPISGYTFDRWVALPQGAKTDGNRATFTANQNATVEAAYRPSRRTMFIVK